MDRLISYLEEAVANIMERIKRLETQEPDKLSLTTHLIEDGALDDDVWVSILQTDTFTIDEQGSYLVHLIVVTTTGEHIIYLERDGVLDANYVVPNQMYQLWAIVVPPLGSTTLRFRALSNTPDPNSIVGNRSRVLVQKVSA